MATNNCVVLKPTGLTPMTALVLADLEETFAPIALSNPTAFGLSSGLCTNDFRRMPKYGVSHPCSSPVSHD